MNESTEPRLEALSKVVSFRVSDVEYESAILLCRMYGYRGMSGLARSAFLAFRPHGNSVILSAQQAETAQLQLRSLLMELNQVISSLNGFREELLNDPTR